MPHRCAFGCKATDVVMHVFPNPNKYPDHFKTWVRLVGGDLQTLPDSEIYRKKRICDIHFTDNVRNRFKRLNTLAVPSLHLPAEGSAKTRAAPDHGVAVPGEARPTATAGATSGVVATNNAGASKPKRILYGANHKQQQKAKLGGPSGQAKQAKPAKRNRPDDSITPQGSGKRCKPHTNASGSYADALKFNDLCVAVRLEPFADLSKEQAEAIEWEIMDVLDDEIFSPSTSVAPVSVPQFRGMAFDSEGTLKLWCGNEFTLQWLRLAIQRVKSPRAGSRLVVCKQSEIPRRVKAGLLIPQVKKEDTPDSIRRRLSYQNPNYNINNWALYNVTPTEDGKSMYLILGVLEDDARKLREEEGRLYYRLGNVYVRFPEDHTNAQAHHQASEEVPVDPDATSSRTPSSATEPKVGTGSPRLDPTMVLDDLGDRSEGGLDSDGLDSDNGAASSPL